MDTPFSDLIPALADIGDAALCQALQARLDQKTKPVGALGRLETLAVRLGEILGTVTPRLEQPQLVVFAADHGLVAQGVSAFPGEVTWQMVQNFLAQGAAVNVLARQHGIAMTVADCGVAQQVPPRAECRPGDPRLVTCRIGAGTADASLVPAMDSAQCAQALANGRALVRDLPGNVLLLGEMGIGNTSAAALLLACLGGFDISECTGAGTGLDAGGIAHKAAVLRRCLARHGPDRAPLAVLASLGGFEIATMVGAVLQAALERRVVLVDGFITGAAVVVAHALQPLVLQRCLFAHRSRERGHGLMLQHLGAEPLVDLGLRLGEGSGAALVWPLLQSAVRVLDEMASFASAGVSGRSEAA